MFLVATSVLRRLTVFAASLALATGFSLLVLAWSGPSGTPPGGNPELIHVGVADQVKAGTLRVEALVADRLCIGEQCIDGWPDLGF